MMQNENGIGHYDQPPPLRQLIQSLDNKVDKHIDQQAELNKKIERLFSVVMGDPEAEVKGLVHHVKDHGTYISRDKKIKWFGAGLAATGGTSLGIMQYWEKVRQFLGM